MKIVTNLAVVLVMSSATVIGQEKWSYKDGKSANLELVRTFKQEENLVGEFKDKEGAIVTITESMLVKADATRLREFRNPVNQEFPLIGAAIASLREGKELTQEEIAACEAEKDVYFNKLTEKNGTGDNTEFAKDDQCDCYIVMIKMALINFKNHGGWAFRSTLRLMVADELKQRAENTDDSFLHFCSIFPSLSRRDVKHAVDSFKMIQKSDEYLTNIATKWAKQYLRDSNAKKEFLQSTGLE